MLTDWLTEWGTLRVRVCAHPLHLVRERDRDRDREIERERERKTEREREREREGERDVEYGYWIYFIAFNDGSFTY